MKANQKQDGRIVVALVSVVVIGLMVAAGFYVYQSQRRNADTSTQPATTQTVANNNIDTVDIPELGIKLSKIADWEYVAKTDSSGSYVWVVSNAYAQETDAKCSGSVPITSSPRGNFAALSKKSGTYVANDNDWVNGKFLAQFDGYYITVSYPNGNPCEGVAKYPADKADMLEATVKNATAL